MFVFIWFHSYLPSKYDGLTLVPVSGHSMALRYSFVGNLVKQMVVRVEIPHLHQHFDHVCSNEDVCQKYDSHQPNRPLVKFPVHTQLTSAEKQLLDPITT